MHSGFRRSVVRLRAAIDRSKRLCSRPGGRSVLALGCLWMMTVGLPGNLLAQAVSNPNQIVGTVEVTNTNPEILTGLAEAGLAFGRVHANSTVIFPTLGNTTSIVVDDPTHARYEVTAEAGSAGAGIVYEVFADVWFAGGAQRVRLPTFTTEPLEEEPATDQVVDFELCLGRIDLSFVDAEGQPATINASSLNFYQETAPGSGSFVWRGSAARGTSTLQALVPAGPSSLYRLDLIYISGSDVYDDYFLFQESISVDVGCDQVVPLTLTPPSGDDGGELGRIVGRVDMLGEDVTSTVDVQASSGPFSNQRRDRVEPPFPADFELRNVLPSTVVDPPAGYYMRLNDLNIRTGERFQFFQSPYLWSNNGGKVEVGAGETVDLGDTFVFDPGYVGGAVRFAGPVEGNTGLESCLSRLVRDFETDTNGDGVPDNTSLTGGSTIGAFGTPTVAPGATLSAVGGYASVGFSGDHDRVSGELLGDYELALGGLRGEVSVWNVDRVNFRFNDRATPQKPDTYFHSWIYSGARTQSPLLIEPGMHHQVPFEHCFGQVNMGFRSTQGTFFQPFLSVAGGYAGTDFTGSEVDHWVSGHGYGTPLNQGVAADRGQVSLCLPQGDYSLTPFVQSVNPNGSVSSTELPPVTLSVGCRQVLDVTSSLQVAVDPVPACSTTASLDVSGSVASSAAVSRIDATVGGTMTSLCTDCGDDPSFAFTADLDACGNTIEIEATNTLGDVAATAVSTRLDHDPPVLDACPDVDLLAAPGSGGAVVDWGLGASDGCDGDRPVVCDVPSGSFLAAGETVVTCTAADACGNETTCSFTARVRDGGDFCFDDGFEDDLDAGWQLSFLGDADQGSATVVDGRLELSGNGTSLYHDDDNAAFLHRSVAGDFRIEVDVEDFPVDAGGAVRKAALMVRSGTGATDPRVMVTFVPQLPDPPTSAIQFDARDGAGNTFELAGTDVGITLPVRLAIERRGDVFRVGYSTDGGASWVQPAGDFGGVYSLAMGETVEAGVAVSSYDAGATLTAAFDDLSLCSPDGTGFDPDDPPECSADQALDVVLLLDTSSSMSHEFGGVVRFEAARAMAHDLLDQLAADGPEHRVALVTFGGGDPFTEVVSDEGAGGFRQDLDALGALLDALTVPSADPLRPTPTSHGLEAVHDLLLGEGDPARRPVLVWATDGVPDVDIEGRGPGVEGPEGYGLHEVQGIRLQDAEGFLPAGIVRHLGEFNTAYGNHDGAVLADAMYALERLEATFGELLIYGLALQGNGVDLGTFNEDLLAYAAYLSGTPYYSTASAGQLDDALASLLGELACGAEGSALVGDRVWSDVDGDGVQEDSEPGLAGVEVEALDDGGSVVASATTDASGAYQLGLPASAAYTVRLVTSTLPEGATATHDVDGVATPNEAVVTVDPWQVRRDVDFGLAPPPGDPLADCVVDGFDTLDPSWSLVGLDGVVVGAQVVDGQLDLASDGSSWWGSDRHAFLFREVSGDFRFEVDLEGFPVDAGGTFRKAGIAIRPDLDPTAARVMAAVIPHFPNPERSVLQHGVRTTAGGSSQELAEPLFAEAPVRLAIERRGTTIQVYHSFNGGATWVQPIDGATVDLDLGETVLVGLGVASYEVGTTMTARFDDAVLCPLGP